jgi:mono/diheme cytochrome c family protein
MFAATSTTIGGLMLFATLLGWVLYAVFNVRGGRKEIGAEQFLAANRKPYYEDEILETKRLERTQLIGLFFLAILTVSLPLYWVLEPGRQANAQFGYEKRFVEWGATLFKPTAQGGFNCAGCHGGMTATGGVASYAITDPKTGEVKAVSWKAPALNTVLYRFSDDEVRFILNYGRPFSPMSAWGTVGGGPMNDQSITTLIAYLHSIQIPQENCKASTHRSNTKGDPSTYSPICDSGTLPAKDNKAIVDEATALVAAGTYKTMGEAYFNMDLNSGAYACARCHTKGWSYGDPQVSGGGALGPNLTSGSSIRQFPKESDMIDFIKNGSELGKRYGEQGQGSGRMPAFGHIYTDEQIKQIVEYVRSL